jgi:CHAT domain-containing protein
MNHPGYANLTGFAKPLTIREIQKELLAPDMAIIEYFVGPQRMAVWIIRSDSNQCIEIEINREDLIHMVEKFRQPFLDIKAGKITNLADIGFNVKTANHLYERIFLPVENYLNKNDHLIIVPDGVLNYVPFEALVINMKKRLERGKLLFSEYENVDFLVEKYPISYIPAISILDVQRKTKKAKESSKGLLLAFGSPDFGPFTGMRPDREKEMSTKLAAIYKMSGGSVFTELDSSDAKEVSEILKPSRLYTGKQATEDMFKQEAEKYPHLYLSTHAVINERQPMYSMIALAQDEDPSEDGFLHSYEVFNMELSTDLVTLSACETGLGKLHRGEAMIGLTRSFMYAGASSIVVSLWTVEESSALLMRYFYENLKKGLTKAKALQHAKLDMLKNHDKGMSYAHPFLWSPFILVGEWN